MTVTASVHAGYHAFNATVYNLRPPLDPATGLLDDMHTLSITLVVYRVSLYSSKTVTLAF